MRKGNFIYLLKGLKGGRAGALLRTLCDQSSCHLCPCLAQSLEIMNIEHRVALGAGVPCVCNGELLALCDTAS